MATSNLSYPAPPPLYPQRQLTSGLSRRQRLEAKGLIGNANQQAASVDTPYVAPTSIAQTPAGPTPLTYTEQARDIAGQNLVSAGNVVGGAVSGAGFDPFKLQQQQALARSEQNQRAATASQIHRAGFAGTPIGAAAGNAMESALLRNRFDTNLGIEVERQNAMRQGANMAMQYGDAVNRFDADNTNLQWAKEDRAGDEFASLSGANPQWWDAVKAAGTSPLARASAMNALRGDPQFNQTMQRLWEASGGQGAFTDDFAFSKMDALNRTTNVRRQTEDLARQLFPDNEEMAAKLTDLLVGEMVPEAMGLEVYKDEDGNRQVRTAGSEEKYEKGITNPVTSKYAHSVLTDPDKKDTEEYREIISDIVNGFGTSIKTHDLLSMPADARMVALKALNTAGKVKSEGRWKKGGNGHPELTGWGWNPATGTLVTYNGRYAMITGYDGGSAGANQWREYYITYLDGNCESYTITKWEADL